ncbi:O-antigen ligase family protein [Candidatus Poribacteria bacterium]|nr:O-antigen ligase family protein [Candidatus Poribacteria bacterium]
MSRDEHSISRMMPINVTLWTIWGAGLAAAYFLSLALFETSPWRALALIGAGVAVFAVRNFCLLVILLMTSSLITRGPVNILGDITPFDVLVALMGAHAFIRIVVKRARVALSREAKFMLLLLLLVFFSEALGFLYFPRRLFMEASAKPFIQLLEFTVVMFALVVCIDSKEQIEKIVRWQIICAAFLAAVAIYEAQRGVIFFGDQSVFGTNEYSLRGDLKSNPNSLLLIIPAIAFLLYEKKRSPAKLALMAFILFPFIPQGTRTFYLALCGAVAGMLWLRRDRKTLWVIPVALIAVFLNSAVVFPKVQEVFESIHGYFKSPYAAEESSTFGRLILWKTAPQIFVRHPLWGFGVNGYGMEIFADPSVFSNERIMFAGWARGVVNPAGKTHNEYLQILLDHGAIAFAMAVYLLLQTLRKSLAMSDAGGKDMAWIYSALFVSFVAYMFASLSISLLSYHGNNFLQVFFWLNTALIYAPVNGSGAQAPALDAPMKQKGNRDNWK